MTVEVPKTGSVIGNTVSGGTPGSVLYVGAGSVLAQDNANFFWDSSAHRLGLGTIAPAITLDVAGSSNEQIHVTNGTLYGYLGSAGSNTYVQLGSYDSGTGVRPLILNPLGGRVGIGTTTPNTAYGNTLEIKAPADNCAILLSGTTGLAGMQYDSGALYFDISTANSFIWRNSAAGTFTEHMRLDSAGNLTITGTITVTGGTGLGTLTSLALDINSNGGTFHSSASAPAGVDQLNWTWLGTPIFGITSTGKSLFAAPKTSAASFNLPTGTAPTSPVDGDVWREDNTNTGLKVRINGVTKTIVVV